MMSLRNPTWRCRSSSMRWDSRARRPRLGPCAGQLAWNRYLVHCFGRWFDLESLIKTPDGSRRSTLVHLAGYSPRYSLELGSLNCCGFADWYQQLHYCYSIASWSNPSSPLFLWSTYRGSFDLFPFWLWKQQLWFSRFSISWHYFEYDSFLHASGWSSAFGKAICLSVLSGRLESMDLSGYSLPKEWPRDGSVSKVQQRALPLHRLWTWNCCHEWKVLWDWAVLERLALQIAFGAMMVKSNWCSSAAITSDWSVRTGFCLLVVSDRTPACNFSLISLAALSLYCGCSLRFLDCVESSLWWSALCISIGFCLSVNFGISSNP